MHKLIKNFSNIFSPGKAHEKGFTLIELLVVVGILAALAGVVTLGVTNFIGEGASEACTTDWHNVQTASTAHAAAEDGACAANTAELISDGYLLDTPKGTYSIGANCKVTQDSCN